jgi:hypothetical protein
MTERSQLGRSTGWPAGMYHHLQCSARRVEISGKWLILIGEIVVNAFGDLVERPRLGVACGDLWNGGNEGDIRHPRRRGGPPSGGAPLAPPVQPGLNFHRTLRKVWRVSASVR